MEDEGMGVVELTTGTMGLRFIWFNLKSLCTVTKGVLSKGYDETLPR